MIEPEPVMVSPYNTLPNVLKEFHLPETITIYDSTLRDGEQMPGVCFTPEQKLQLACKLDAMGVPEIEAGFPAVSKTEQSTIKTIANEGLKAKILVLSRLKQEDIDAARAVDADLVLLFIASSPLHLQYKLHRSEHEIKQLVQESIEYALDHGITPSFSTEDSTRTPLPFLEELVTLAYEVGAERIGFTDTLGCATPQTIDHIFRHMRRIVPTPFSAHLHNDFGLALANALAALNAGATHLCTTINGWGERAGNVPLEQLVMTIQTLYDVSLGIDTSQLTELSKMVAEFTHLPLSKMQPFTGENVFSHESGIHVAAMMQHPRTYEAIAPENVGNTRHFIIGKHTGKHFIQQILRSNGYQATEEQLSEITSQIKQLGEQRGSLSEEELLKFVHQMMLTEEEDAKNLS